MAQGQKWVTEAERKAALKASQDKWLEAHPKYHSELRSMIAYLLWR